MGKFFATKLVFDNYIREYVCSDYAPIEFEKFEDAKMFVDNEYEKYSISYNEEVIYNNINFICKINGIRVSEEKFNNELFKASGKDFIEMEDLENRLLALGYQKVNGIEFELVNLIDKKIVLYDNSIEYDEENDVFLEKPYEFETFEEFIESLEYNIEVAMEYDLEEENIEEMSIELALEYALQTMFSDNNYEYIVNGFIYKVEDIEE